MWRGNFARNLVVLRCACSEVSSLLVLLVIPRADVPRLTEAEISDMLDVAWDLHAERLLYVLFTMFCDSRIRAVKGMARRSL